MLDEADAGLDEADAGLEGVVLADQGRPRGRGSGIALQAVLCVVIAAVLAVSGTNLLRRVRPVPTADEAALASMLAERAAALLRQDRVGWLSAVDAGSASARAIETATFDRITALPISAWAYRITGLSGPGGESMGTPVPGHRYRAQLTLTYRLSGDTRDVRRSRTANVVLAPNRDTGGLRWLLESERPATEADRDLWDLAPLTVARTGHGVAVALDGTPSQAAGLAAGADTAARAVDAVWGSSWPRTVLVVLPRDGRQFAVLAGRSGGTGLDRLAAVTTGPLERDRRSSAPAGSADRVIVNPQLWNRLSGTGRRVVLAHELTHVATRATTMATPPTWLDEGFASYVGYLGQGVPDTEIAADTLPAVRAGRLPAALPAPGDFDPSASTSGAAYAQAWVACDLIAARAGRSGLVAVYRASASGGGGEAAAETALWRVIRQPVDSFIADWQTRLRQIAEAGG